MNPKLPKLGIAKMVVLFFVTLGLHPAWWFFRVGRALPAGRRGRGWNATLAALGLCWIVGLVATSGEVYYLTNAEIYQMLATDRTSEQSLAALDAVMSFKEKADPYENAKIATNLGYFIALTYLSLRIRKVLEALHPEGEYSIAYTSLFGPFYLQRQINRDGAHSGGTPGLAA